MMPAYQVIDEISYNVLGRFDSQEEAMDLVATLVSATVVQKLRKGLTSWRWPSPHPSLETGEGVLTSR